MDMLLLYYVLLALWVPLLWPALRLRGWQRGAVLVAVLAGALATANEVWQTVGAVNAIRLDIFVFIMVLGLLYTAAMAVLWLARWRLASLSLGVVLALTGGAIGYRWVQVQEEIAQVTAKLDERDALIFRAKFRDRATYDAYFGSVAGAGSSYPVGHWQAPDGAWFRRLIVNGNGQAWLFYRCGKTECAYGPTDRPLERAAGATGFEWRGLLRPVAGELLAVRIVRQDDDRVSVETREQAVAFTRAPPPLDPAPVPDTVAFLGSYAAASCIGKHAAVRQLWLWRQGERLFAVGVFQTLLAGQRALFVTPSAMGEGRRDGEAWVFDWKREGEPWTASVRIEADSVSLRLTPFRLDAVTASLAPGTIFQDETIALAPRSTAEDWKRWFGTVWVGHSFSGAVPACP